MNKSINQKLSYYYNVSYIYIKHDNIILTIIFLIKIEIIKLESVLFLPLKIDEIDENNFEITKLEKSNIYTEINIGKPNQKVKLYLSFNFYLTYIFSAQVKGAYNHLNSLTYKNISKAIYYFEDFDEGIISNETIFLDSNNSKLEIDNYSFDLITKIENNKEIDEEGYLGLKLFDNIYRGDALRSLILQLKKRHIIESYGWSIKFQNNEGLLSIGAYPHEYDTVNYDTRYFKITVSGWKPTGSVWQLEFDNIITGYGNYIEKIKKCELIIEAGLIFGTTEYFDIVKKEFFDEKVNQKECFMKESHNSSNINFKYFYCTNLETIKQFKGIHFKSNSLDKDFFFDYNDLFLQKNNKYYFLIVFRPSSITNWIIGFPLFKKYEFLFQPEQKLIGTYIDYPKRKNEDNSMNNSMVIMCLVVGVLAIIIFVLGFIIYKLLTKKLKKKRANELDDNFDYVTSNEDNKLIN